MPSRRQERVAKRVTQELVEALRNLKHVRLGFITITKCEVSPDLRHAKVFVSVWGEDEEKERNMAVLRQHASRLKGMIGRPLGLKATPDLHFEFDDSLATADRIGRLIRDARQTDANPEPLTPEEEQALRLARPGVSSGKRRGGDDAEDIDPFEESRLDVEDELLDLDDDPDWEPINLDEALDDGEED